MEENKMIKLEDAEYFSAEGISISALKNMAISPKYYKYRLENPSEPTAAQALGTAIHSAILEPEKFQEKYFVTDEKIDRRTKEGKALIEEVGDREIISSDVIKCKEAVMEKIPELENCIKENAVFWKENGLLFKSKLDAYDELEEIIYDLKTVTDISADAVERSIYNFKYYMQAAQYKKAVEATGKNVRAFVIVAIEKQAPYDVARFEISPEYIRYGEAERKRYIDQLIMCDMFSSWSGVEANTGIISVNIPKYAKSLDVEA